MQFQESRMEEPHQRAMRELRVFLLDNVVVSEVIDHIIEQDGVTLDEQDKLDSIGPKRDKMRYLLDCLQRKERAVYKAFIKGLQHCHSHHVVDRLQEKIDFIKQKNQDPSGFDVDPSQLRSPDDVDARPVQQGPHWLLRYLPSSTAVSDRLLTLIALQVADPSALGGILGLPYALCQQCRMDHLYSSVSHTEALLQAWKRGKGARATIDVLVPALERGGFISEDMRKVIEEELGRNRGPAAAAARDREVYL